MFRTGNEILVSGKTNTSNVLVKIQISLLDSFLFLLNGAETFRKLKKCERLNAKRQLIV